MKKQTKFLHFLWMILLPFSAIFAQQGMELQVVGAAGTVVSSGSNATVHFTVGEIMVAEAVNNNLLPQGFHQIIVWQLIPTDEPTEANLNVKVYPNPTTAFLQIETDEPIEARLFDLNGRAIGSKVKIENLAEMDLSQFSAGIYLLQTNNSGKSTQKTFRIQVIK